MSLPPPPRNRSSPPSTVEHVVTEVAVEVVVLVVTGQVVVVVDRPEQTFEPVQGVATFTRRAVRHQARGDRGFGEPVAGVVGGRAAAAVHDVVARTAEEDVAALIARDVVVLVRTDDGLEVRDRVVALSRSYVVLKVDGGAGGSIGEVHDVQVEAVAVRAPTVRGVVTQPRGDQVDVAAGSDVVVPVVPEDEVRVVIAQDRVMAEGAEHAVHVDERVRALAGRGSCGKVDGHRGRREAESRCIGVCATFVRVVPESAKLVIRVGSTIHRVVTVVTEDEVGSSARDYIIAAATCTDEVIAAFCDDTVGSTFRHDHIRTIGPGNRLRLLRADLRCYLSQTLGLGGFRRAREQKEVRPEEAQGEDDGGSPVAFQRFPLSSVSLAAK